MNFKQPGANIEQPDLLSTVIADLEKKEEYEALVPPLMEISRNKTKKDALLYAFNMHSVSCRFFSFLMVTEVKKLSKLLGEFLGTTEKEETASMAEKIALKLTNS